MIWYGNYGKKTVHGVEFELVLLGSAGTRIRASDTYHAKGDVAPNNHDIVVYPAADEQASLGDKWYDIDGVEVSVTSVMFNDATVWRPRKRGLCKSSFLNENYSKVAARYAAETDRRMAEFVKKWNREHPDAPFSTGETPKSKRQ